MKFALVGHTGHWTYYAQMLKDLPKVSLAAVAISSPDESLETFSSTYGVTSKTPRYKDYRVMLQEVSPEVVQICSTPNQIPEIIETCLKRKIAVISEKPLAMDLPTLSRLYQITKDVKVPLVPMHAKRGLRSLVAIREAICTGQIGEPLVSSSQISYKWGTKRPDWFRSRKTFPGIGPYIGIHAIDWLVWMFGDVFVEVLGQEAQIAYPDYPACASQAGFLLRMQNGGVATIALDFLRPESAPTHEDERVRVTGTSGVIEGNINENTVQLISQKSGSCNLKVHDIPYWYTSFVKSIQGKSRSFIDLQEGFRITELAIKAQQAADEGKNVSLTKSPYVIDS